MLSVVIVSWNRAAELERCLRSVREYTRYSPFELIVVDNGSTDRSKEVVRSVAPEATLIENARNLGAGHARNQGVEAARGDLICLLDCDTYVTDDVIGCAARTLVARPGIAMLGCELRFPDGRRQHTAHRAMSIRLSLVQHLWLYRLIPASRRGEVLLGPYWEEDREVEADWIVGAFIMVWRRLFVEEGGFNEHLFPEDSEWGIRMTRAGHTVLYAPHVGVVYHTGAVADLDSDQERLRMYHRAGVAAYRELNGAALAHVYRGVELFGVTVRWLVYRTAVLLHRNPYLSAQVRRYRSLVDIYLRLNARL